MCHLKLLATNSSTYSLAVSHFVVCASGFPVRLQDYDCAVKGGEDVAVVDEGSAAEVPEDPDGVVRVHWRFLALANLKILLSMMHVLNSMHVPGRLYVGGSTI